MHKTQDVTLPAAGRKRITGSRAALALLLLALLTWSALALLSGALLPDGATAVAPGEVTDDGWSAAKRVVALPSGQVAFLDVGEGPPVVLLHGCPFSGIEWQEVVPDLARRARVIVPDLRGLGDTPVALSDDYSLPTDVVLVKELLAHLGVDRAAFVAHDHGGAVLQLLLADRPELVERAVLANAEAYDAWPSEPERIYLELIVHPASSPLMFAALQLEAVRRSVFSIAVHDPATLTAERLAGWTEPHTSSAARWQRLRRFYRGQLDPAHPQLTLDAVPHLRAYTGPVLLVWGARDENFGPAVAERLARDLGNPRGIVWLERSSHLPMVEEPAAFGAAVLSFLLDDQVDPVAVEALARVRRAS